MTDDQPLRITLSGDLGSGKSSVGRQIAGTLGIPYFSAGALFRDIGQIENLDALKTNLAAENNTAIDFAVDKRTREIDQTVPSFVIDSRMAWHFVSRALRVYLGVSRETAAWRVMADGARTGERYDSHAAAVAALTERRQSETKRYRGLYGVDITDLANYDLAVITDDIGVDDVAALVLAFTRAGLPHKFWLPKTRLVPLTPWRDDPAPAAAATEAAAPLDLTVVHNWGFYAGPPAPLAAALAADGPFVAYAPQTAADAEEVFDRARRQATPGALARWGSLGHARLTFADLLGPARP